MPFVSYAEAVRLPEVRAAINEADLEIAVRAEVAGSAVWARRAPGLTNIAGNLALEVNVSAAIAAGFKAT